jgi:hypothetical protein
MLKFIVSKMGYFYKIVNDKKIRISKEQYLKKNKNLKGGAPKTNISVIFVGAAEIKKSNNSRNNRTGQIPNLMEYIEINPENTLITVDPGHGNNEIPHLSTRSGINVSKMTDSNDVRQGCLNVSYLYSRTFFENFIPEESTYYVIFAFGGIGKEIPSCVVAQLIGIINPFFYDIRNALCFGMSCSNIPPNITRFLINYGFNLNPVLIPEIDQSLENAFYALNSGLRALYKVEEKENNISRTERQINEILELLKKINIDTRQKACSYYQHLKTTYGLSKDVYESMFKELIDAKYKKNNLLEFFRNR